MKTYAIILSAGKGKRMQSTISKQYIEVLGYPVLYYTLKAFEKSKVDNIIIVAGQDDIEYIRKDIIEKYNIDTVKMICRFIYDFQNLTNSKLAIKIKDKYI